MGWKGKYKKSRWRGKGGMDPALPPHALARVEIMLEMMLQRAIDGRILMLADGKGKKAKCICCLIALLPSCPQKSPSRVRTVQTGGLVFDGL